MLNADEKRKPPKGMEDRNVLTNDQDRPLCEKDVAQRGAWSEGGVGCAKIPSPSLVKNPSVGPLRLPCRSSNKTKICSLSQEASHHSLCLRPLCFSLWCCLFPFSLKVCTLKPRFTEKKKFQCASILYKFNLCIDINVTNLKFLTFCHS